MYKSGKSSPNKAENSCHKVHKPDSQERSGSAGSPYTMIDGLRVGLKVRLLISQSWLLTQQHVLAKM